MATTTATTDQAITRPEYFRLPKPGHADPYFSFSRSFYYQLEARGLLKLVRIRDEGKERGVTLIPYRKVEAFVSQAEREAEARREKETAAK